jgi:hypothetical protein
MSTPPPFFGQGLPRNFKLQPLTPLHVAILRQVESPMLLAAQIVFEAAKQSTQQTAARLAKFDGMKLADETRETIFILSTPFAKLKALRKMDRATLRAAALAAIPDFKTDNERSAAQRSIGLHLDSGLRQLAKHNFKIEL